MLSANAMLIIAAVVMIVVIAEGLAHASSVATIITRCVLTAAVAWIFALTLFPIPVDAREWQFYRRFSDVMLVPFHTIRAQLAFGLEHSEARQLIGNVALFLPFGFLLPFAVRTCRRLWVALVVAASLSVLIESLQALLPGHTTDVDDVILNTVGAALGYLAFSMVARIGRRRPVPKEHPLPGSAPSSAG